VAGEKGRSERAEVISCGGGTSYEGRGFTAKDRRTRRKEPWSEPKRGEARRAGARTEAGERGNVGAGANGRAWAGGGALVGAARDGEGRCPGAKPAPAPADEVAGERLLAREAGRQAGSSTTAGSAEAKGQGRSAGIAACLASHLVLSSVDGANAVLGRIRPFPGLARAVISLRWDS
jgi:hypothetical protein